MTCPPDMPMPYLVPGKEAYIYQPGPSASNLSNTFETVGKDHAQMCT